jgi:proteasome lid subunit RPN8/RPN11
MLYLPKAEYDDIRNHAHEAYPHECCGVLLGRFLKSGARVQATAHCTNLRTDSPQLRYEIDPRELVRVQREARESGLEIVGFYHSHPDHLPHWSPTDLNDAHWIGYSYVIVSVAQGKPTEMKSFVLSGTREEDKVFEEEQVVLE